MDRVSSRDNPRFRQLRRWAEKARARRDDGVLLLDGLHLIDALLQSGGSIVGVFVSTGGGERAENRQWLADHAGFPATELPDAMFAEVASTETPSGILAVGRTAPTPAPCDADGDCLLLDGVQDPGNVGTLLRTAAAAGIGQVLLSPACADAWSPKALRAGQGAQFVLHLREDADLVAFLATYAGRGIVTALDAPQSLFETALDGPLAWVFGAEGQGVSAPVRAAAMLAVRIPMPGPVESLNVGAAAAVCLFEAVRRRAARG